MDFGEWLKDQRERHGWKAEEVARRLREAGYQAETSSYRVWETGRRPRPETVRALERLFGSVAPSVAAPPATELSAVLASLKEQTDLLRHVWQSIDALTEAIRSSQDKVSATVLREIFEELADRKMLVRGEGSPAPRGSSATHDADRPRSGARE